MLKIKNLFSDLSPIIIIINKKINMEKLCDLLLELDSDEGIRIDNPISGKKIYINRNLLGIYNILIRTKKEKKTTKAERKITIETSLMESIMKKFIVMTIHHMF